MHGSVAMAARRRTRNASQCLYSLYGWFGIVVHFEVKFVGQSRRVTEENVPFSSDSKSKTRTHQEMR